MSLSKAETTAGLEYGRNLQLVRLSTSLSLPSFLQQLFQRSYLVRAPWLTVPRNFAVSTNEHTLDIGTQCSSASTYWCQEIASQRGELIKRSRVNLKQRARLPIESANQIAFDACTCTHFSFCFTFS